MKTKKPYSKPKIKAQGNVEKITLGSKNIGPTDAYLLGGNNYAGSMAS